MRRRQPVDFRLLRRLEFDILLRELNATLPGYQLISSQEEIENFVSLRRSFKLHVRGFIKRTHVMQFIDALQTFWTSGLGLAGNWCRWSSRRVSDLKLSSYEFESHALSHLQANLSKLLTYCTCAQAN